MAEVAIGYTKTEQLGSKASLLQTSGT